jgi:diguanylate cyclase (GGDEF)-like protein
MPVDVRALDGAATTARLGPTGPAPADSAAREWHRRLVRTKLRRRVELATYAGGGAGIIVLWAIARWNLVSRRPLWLLVAVFAAVGLAGFGIDALHNLRPTRLTAQLRAAVPAMGVTVIIYLIGWGPALAIGYVFPMLNMTFYGATRRALHLAIWPLAGMGVGQILVATGDISLRLDERASFALATLGAIAVIFAAVLVAQVAAGKEDAERELAYAASHDRLTGLMNRSVFTEWLARLVSGSRRRAEPVAVLFCDLLGFKDVNDRLGHDAGDQVLAQVGQRIVSCTRTEDLVARFGGDEFVVGFAAPAGSAATLALADRILAALEEPINVNGEPVRVGCSIGIAFCDSGNAEVNNLLSEADAAMYQAKAVGRPARILHSMA